MPVYFSKTRNIRDLTRVKPVAGNSIQVSHLDGRNPTTGPSPLPPWDCNHEKLKSGAGAWWWTHDFQSGKWVS